MEEDAPHPPEDPPTYINTIITDSGGDPSAVGQDNATATMVAMARRIIELREENRGLRNQNARGSAEIGRLKLELSLSKEKICHLESEVSGYVQELARKISLEETDNRGRSPRGKKRTFSETDVGAPGASTTDNSRKRVVVCIRCFQYSYHCDRSTPCGQCATDGAKCKRARCEHFATGTCMRQQCTRAHEEDGISPEHLGDSRHVSKRKGKKRN